MDKFEALQKLGAGEFQHLNGSLEKHLEGTQKMLLQWGANQILQDAGLYHAAYGTAGFEDSMIGTDKRQEIAKVIGVEAEQLVYLYCSCDREYVFPQFTQQSDIKFKDRFNGELFSLTEAQTQSFCELTVANELELVLESEGFKAKYGKELLTLFEGMKPYLTDKATAAYRNALT